MLARIERRWGLAGRLALVLVVLLCAYGLLVAAVGARLLQRQEQESLQRLSHGLARHIVEHWPRVGQSGGDGLDRRELDALLGMLMVVNPAIEVYVLDANGRVRAYLGDSAAVRQPQVALAPIQAFLSGAALPLLGSDPKGRPMEEGGTGKIFSAARFAQRPGETEPPGYLYVVLQGQAQAQVAGHIGQARLWQGLAALLAVALLLTLLLGLGLIRRLTRPLRRLAGRMASYGPGGSAEPAAADPGDEVRAIELAFEAMALRIDRQLRERAADQAAHQELVANLAHDLRTPLTVLHGHLETLQRHAMAGAAAQHLAIALGQSDKVRRLSQQLFELAALQGRRQQLQRERFRLDELLSDTVQKFSLPGQGPPLRLVGTPPEPIELEADLQLIDRAINNLIDNARRHAPGSSAIEISLQCSEREVSVLVEDGGPGLPEALRHCLDRGESLRAAPLYRPGGGIGGLGLAIVQRIAILHGGRLGASAAQGGGARLCLALPRLEAGSQGR